MSLTSTQWIGIRPWLPIGTILHGRFHILQVVRQHGACLTYEAYDLQRSERMCLKALPAAARGFQEKARALNALRHPGVPDIYGYFQEAGQYYLAFERVEGPTLEDVVHQTPHLLSEDQVLYWIDDLTQVLECLNRLPRPIVVGCISPANLVLTADDRVRLIDLALSEDAAEGGAFAGPETYCRQINVRSDIYALGATMYGLLTRREVPAAADRVLGQLEVPPPSFFNSLVTPAVDAAVMGMLEPDAERRPRTIAQVRQALLARG